MKFNLVTELKIDSKKDLKKVRKFMNSNNIDLKDINISELARNVGCSWDTARNHLVGNLKGYPKIKKSKVDKVDHLIQEVLDNPKILIKNKTAFYRYLKREHDELVDFKIGAFKRYLNLHYSDKLKKKKGHSYTTRFETKPGIQCQLDYKEHFGFIQENGDRVKVDVAVIIWGFSRHVYRKVIRDKTTTSTVEFLAEAFEYYGGIPNELIVDNPKALVFEHNSKTGEYILNTEFEQFARDYGINIRPARPYRPETKGKVERTMRDIEDMEYYNGKLLSIYDFATKLDILTKEYHMRVHSTTSYTPNLLLKKEKEHMLTLPSANIRSKYKFVSNKTYKISKAGTFKFTNGCSYSVPYDLINKIVVVSITKEKLHIYYNNKFVTSHDINENKRINVKEEHKHASIKQKEVDKVPNTMEMLDDEITEQANNNINSLASIGG